MYELMINRGLTIEEMANFQGMEIQSVHNNLVRHGLITRYLEKQEKDKMDYGYLYLIHEGMRIEDIAETENCEPANVFRRISGNMNLRRTYLKRHHPCQETEESTDNISLYKKSKVRKLIDQNKTIKEISNVLRVTPYNAYIVIREFGLLPEYQSRHPSEKIPPPKIRIGIFIDKSGRTWRNTKYDELETVAKNGKLSLTEIGKLYNVTGERIRTAMKERGFYEEWKDAREKYKAEKRNKRQKVRE
jgi:hypothetical protein